MKNIHDTIDGIHYYIQDYMGNNRLVINAATDTIEQVTHYYPYGGVIGDISTNESLQKYKFEGKELDRTFGLDNYDIGARQYFAMAPMWDRIDPLAEKDFKTSPYVYCIGNPVNREDKDGEIAPLVAAAGSGLIAGTIGAVVGGALSYANERSWKKAAGGFTAGFLFGATFGTAGPLEGSGITAYMLGGAISNGMGDCISQVTTSKLETGKVQQINIKETVKSAVVGSICGLVTKGLNVSSDNTKEALEDVSNNIRTIEVRPVKSIMRSLPSKGNLQARELEAEQWRSSAITDLKSKKLFFNTLDISIETGRKTFGSFGTNLINGDFDK